MRQRAYATPRGGSHGRGDRDPAKVRAGHGNSAGHARSVRTRKRSPARRSAGLHRRGRAKDGAAGADRAVRVGTQAVRRPPRRHPSLQGPAAAARRGVLRSPHARERQDAERIAVHGSAARRGRGELVREPRGESAGRREDLPPPLSPQEVVPAVLPARGDRDHLAVELSLLDPGRRCARRADGGQRGGGEAERVHPHHPGEDASAFRGSQSAARAFRSGARQGRRRGGADSLRNPDGGGRSPPGAR